MVSSTSPGESIGIEANMVTHPPAAGREISCVGWPTACGVVVADGAAVVVTGAGGVVEAVVGGIDEVVVLDVDVDVDVVEVADASGTHDPLRSTQLPTPHFASQRSSAAESTSAPEEHPTTITIATAITATAATSIRRAQAPDSLPAIGAT